MSATEDDLSTLQRKLARGRDQAQTQDRSVLRALRLSLARASRDMMELGLTAIGVTQLAVMYEEIAGQLDKSHLLISLDGADGMLAAATLDLPLVAAIIQQQTMGTVSPVEPADRAYTETDAALVAPLIEAVLRRACDMAHHRADKACLDGYGFGARFDSPRNLALAMEAEQFRVFELIVDIAAGTHQGTVRLILPERPLPPSDEERASQDTDSGDTLGSAVMAVPAQLRAVLCRLQVPVSALSHMQPDDLLPLPPLRLDKTELFTVDGQVLTSGRLGQSEGFRAVRLNETGQPRTSLTGEIEGLMIQRPEITSGLAEQAPEMSPNIGAPEILDHAAEEVASARTASGGSDSLASLADMSPDEAAAEISQLAGLTEADREAIEAEDAVT